MEIVRSCTCQAYTWRKSKEVWQKGSGSKTLTWEKHECTSVKFPFSICGPVTTDCITLGLWSYSAEYYNSTPRVSWSNQVWKGIKQQTRVSSETSLSSSAFPCTVNMAALQESREDNLPRWGLLLPPTLGKERRKEGSKQASKQARKEGRKEGRKEQQWRMKMDGAGVVSDESAPGNADLSDTCFAGVWGCHRIAAIWLIALF